ncbi:hypothetical protein PV08_10207 [Exophiala spinifera]|uniref:DNA replication regulator SLD2 n=1 Tax=Exophiala spinifera TaxID=91928 RepID=A0A0D2AW02_9EURO|nr:uncharacterized protein PV08_10207 [Exophiala spinifera]KIW10908.1 hypothetical protein PV08_10207 [Exophiala spinifera]
MDTTVPLLDTPKKASLQRQADTLRAALKDYERTFAAEHDGRKPGRGDIKLNRAIASKYTEYNKLRDVIAGKLGLAALDPPAPKVRTSRADSVNDLTPRRSYKSTPSKPRHAHDLDPYDAPSSISPKPSLHAIGPTPRRDGMVLGIFDMLPPSGSLKSSRDTPSSRKRKIDALNDNTEPSFTPMASQTPSRRRTQHVGTSHPGGDAKDATAATPASRSLSTSTRKHSKTPISQSKRFMLDHFFATPSAVRFSSLVERDEDDCDTESNLPRTTTPLRDALLGLSPAHQSQQHVGSADATPPYLKRSFSFKERLLSASNSRRGSSAGTKTGVADLGTSPTRTRRPGPRGPGPGPAKFAPKPLSQIIAEQASQSKAEDRSVAQTREGGDNGEYDDEDDLEALREIEAGGINILLGDSQLDHSQPGNGGETGAGTEVEQGGRVWKKKGQKRTTRRVIMRPVRMKPAAAPKYVAADEDENSEDELALGNGDDHHTGADMVEETQFVDDGRRAADLHEEEDDMEFLLAEAEQDDENRDFDADGDEEFRLEPAARTKKQKKPSLKARTKDEKAEPDLLGKLAKKKSKAHKAAENPKERTINPNAYSHMNFRSLKIKNKNSKAKGRGKFGRGRR